MILGMRYIQIKGTSRKWACSNVICGQFLRRYYFTSFYTSLLDTNRKVFESTIVYGLLTHEVIDQNKSFVAVPMQFTINYKFEKQCTVLWEN